MGGRTRSAAQVSSIFANFSIEWPEQVKEILAMFAFVTIDVDVAGTECLGRVSYFEKWIGMVFLPFIMLALFTSLGSTVTFTSWVLARTRWPLWAKRKMWRLLKPPVLADDLDDDEDLTTKIGRKLRNLKRKLLFTVLSLLTKPIPRAKLEAPQLAIP